MDTRKYGTCFFEQYAQITLAALLGTEFDGLVNLQSSDGRSVGIEVTRAMEESARAAKGMLKGVAGLTPPADNGDDELERILENGYAYGLQRGKYIGHNELEYWSMALPLRRILESKIAKVGNGFYGHFDKMGLYVFCKDPIRETEALRTLHFAMGLQKYQDLRYDRLYLSEVSSLYVCNLEDGLRDSSRLIRLPITQSQRKAFYMEAIRRQLGEN